MDELLLDNPIAPPRRYSLEQRLEALIDIGTRLRIRCDGIEQKQVIAYDCDAGTVFRNKLDADGRAQVDPKNRNQVWRETVSGNVTVEWNDR